MQTVGICISIYVSTISAGISLKQGSVNTRIVIRINCFHVETNNLDINWEDKSKSK